MLVYRIANAAADRAAARPGNATWSSEYDRWTRLAQESRRRRSRKRRTLRALKELQSALDGASDCLCDS